MNWTPLNDIFNWFVTRALPTQDQFWAVFRSFWHKSEKIPMDSIDGLRKAFEGAASASTVDNHINDENAHSQYLVKKDATNIDAESRELLRQKLGVGDLPPNIALVDDAEDNLIGNVHTKNQIEALYMALSDFVLQNGKIRADKIEALGLTELHEVSENSLAAFCANAANYEFEDNDIIAIADATGNFALYIYRGGIKTQTANYLPTGLTNITIAMVQGLQAALDAKLDKPTTDGSFLVKRTAGTTAFAPINIAANYLPLWNGGNFAQSGIFKLNNNFGIGTEAPSEMLHLQNGRVRTKAVVLEENSENLPTQISYQSRRYYGSDTSAIRRPLMFMEYEDLKGIMQGMSDSQKDAWRLANRKTGENFSLGQPRIDTIIPPILDKTQNFVQYVSLIGINLFVDNQYGTAQVKMVNKTTLAETDITNFQVYQSNPSVLTFGLNFSNIDSGEYYFKVFHNGVWNIVNNNIVLRVENNLVELPLPSLTWTVQTDSGSVSNAPVTTVNSSIVKPQTNLADGNVYVQSSELVSATELQNGVMIVFDFSQALVTNSFHIAEYFGLKNSNIAPQKNNSIDIGFKVTSELAFNYIPSNKSFSVASQNAYSDKIYMIYKNGICTIFFLSLGRITNEMILLDAPLSIKTVIPANTNTSHYLSATVLKKVSLA